MPRDVIVDLEVRGGLDRAVFCELRKVRNVAFGIVAPMVIALIPAVMPATSTAASRTISLPADARQAVVVTAEGWQESAATLQRWERVTVRSEWRKAGEAVRVLIGRNGLGWGLGVHRAVGNGPVKREGDLRGPAGVFHFGTAFKRIELPRFRWPVVDVRMGVFAVDDPRSGYYNRMVDVRGGDVLRDWRSAEDMATVEGYDLGIWVMHNPRRVRGAGSCILIHEWRGVRKGTAGCTVMRRDALIELLTWLEPKRRPVLVQLPAVEMPPVFTGATTTRKP